MAVDPVPSSGVTPPQTQGAGSGKALPAVGGHHHHHGSKGVEASDQVELSTASTSAAAAGDVPSGTLTAEQLQTITQKLAAGAYDGAAAADRLAGKLLDSGDLRPLT